VPAPVITALEIGAAYEATLRWIATTGRTYRIETTSVLGPGNWVDLGAVTATSNTAEFTDTTAAPDGVRFYRVLLVP
jgi:hypothetical protein